MVYKYIKKIWFLTYAKYLKYYVQLIHKIIIGINIDPKIIRQFADQMKNADDKDFENLKKQYQVITKMFLLVKFMQVMF